MGKCRHVVSPRQWPGEAGGGTVTTARSGGGTARVWLASHRRASDASRIDPDGRVGPLSCG